MSVQDLKPIRVICISDTHNAQPPIPHGDILIHAGDLTSSGSSEEIGKAVEWLSSLPHAFKIVIAGNHDLSLDAKHRENIRPPPEDPCIDWSALGLIYLEHSATNITVHGRELRIFGSPLTPEFRAGAFQYPQARALPELARSIWDAIPLNTDILITHGPPFGHMDLNKRNQFAGCPALLDQIWKVRPKLHVFGHIHEGRGVKTVNWGLEQRIKETWTKNNASVLGVLCRLPSLIGGANLGGSKQTSMLVNASIRPSHFSGMPLNQPQIVVI